MFFCPPNFLLKRYALVSATGIFFLGCVASLMHGISSLAHPEPLASLPLAISVISISFAIEGATFLYALKAIKVQAVEAGVGIVDFIRDGDDTVTVAVIVEDFAAMIGK